jgi:hypothetical protein
MARSSKWSVYFYIPTVTLCISRLPRGQYRAYTTIPRPELLYNPSSLPFSDYWGSFPGLKRPWREVNHPPHLAPRLRISGAVILLVLYASIRVTFVHLDVHSCKKSTPKGSHFWFLVRRLSILTRAASHVLLSPFSPSKW